MSQQVKAAVFASGNGSNFQAMLDEQVLPCQLVLLVCDQEGAPVIEKAERQGIPVFVFHPKDYSSKHDYEQEILKKLQLYEVDWIFLAGYMRLIGTELLREFKGKILNIHPSLLPSFPGLDAIGQALEAGVTETGVTVQFIDEGMDTGPIILQKAVPILPSDTKETLSERIHHTEHRLYIQAIQHVIKGVR